MNTSIRAALESDFEIISELAHYIWPATYSSIISTDQIAFMLDQSYSMHGLSKAVAQGKVFYLLEEDDVAIGFIAIRALAEKKVLRIESLYLHPSAQGKGYGQLLIDFAAELAKVQSLHILELNVNRNNKAYYFYQKMGFAVSYEIDIPYHGYVLNDYVMQKAL